ncbi:hypothetical protein [Cuneatibacter caecimuris]|jgi:hypothetical protein|uniref:Uncharacterized protein n=1 Tax=Cuneatibacter caecimuris TaxID=1796618 RepID=A0A4Q7P436_9FIRM|nr:hypothetical protein [Cuneatibacter caecimuris]RZS94190.1 hypothetical protein EV209_2560 [Cuneatibacter caecimuris]
MSKKITWYEIYQDFQRRFPRLSKDAARYQPNGYLSILVYFRDGTQLIYDYMEQRGRLITA